MSPALLVLNAGSSSLKFSLYAGGAEPAAETLLCRGACSLADGKVRVQGGRATPPPVLAPGASQEQALAAVLAWAAAAFPGLRLGAVGHRVVHGGPRFSAAVAVDGDVLEALRALIPLAPLHQPQPIAAIETLARLHPGVLQAACFDTAFHHTQPPVAAAFALPRRLSEAGVRRYGFHGLSYDYIAGELARRLPALAQGRVVAAHLGAGASLCALQAGRSIATTMGFTALDGLPMGTRCGALDPGVVLHLQEAMGMSPAQVSHLLHHQSGLLGVSGLSGDMRVLLASDDPRAGEAVALFVYRIGRELGSLAAALGGLDGLVFTGGVGENAAPVRAAVCEAAAWLGVRLDAEANAAGGPIVSRAESAVTVLVLPTDEELVIARHTFALTLAG